jgi:transcriptional regulator GlxA family with amidase domain
MLYNDAGLTRARVDPRKQLNAALLCTLVGMLLQEMPRSRRRSPGWGLTAPHPGVARAAQMLADDPSLSAADLAAHLQVSAGSLARVFKSERGISIVRYRNQLRLERFLDLMDGGGISLGDAALAAGFGSYAQFHRVFQALRGTTPRVYLGRRGGRGRLGAQRRRGSRK